MALVMRVTATLVEGREPMCTTICYKYAFGALHAPAGLVLVGGVGKSALLVATGSPPVPTLAQTLGAF